MLTDQSAESASVCCFAGAGAGAGGGFLAKWAFLKTEAVWVGYLPLLQLAILIIHCLFTALFAGLGLYT